MYRNLPKECEDDLPFVGFIAFSENEGFELSEAIAAGFLRSLEGGYGVLDSYISDPSYSALYRHDAFCKINRQLIDIGKQMGMKKILAFSLEASLIDRVCQDGFIRVPYDFAVLQFD
jgi:hypothetical protein